MWYFLCVLSNKCQDPCFLLVQDYSSSYFLSIAEDTFANIYLGRRACQDVPWDVSTMISDYFLLNVLIILVMFIKRLSII